MTALSSLAEGFKTPLRAWPLLKANKKLRFWCGLSASLYFTIGLSLWISTSWLAWSRLDVKDFLSLSLGGYDAISAWGPWLASTLLGLTALALSALMAAVSYGLYLLINIFMVPVHMCLAEHALLHKGVLKQSPFRLRSWLSVSWRMSIVSIKKFIFLSCLGLWLLFISYFPFLNWVAYFLGFVIIAFDLMDYHFELLEWSFRQRLRFFNQHRAYFAGLAGLLCALSFVPIAGLVVLPFIITAPHLQLQRR